jgi:hypothetical protein
MSIPVHTIQVLDPQTGNDFFDRVILGQKTGIAYTASAGASYNVSFSEGLPQAYSVFVSLNSASSGGPPYVTNKTSTGFTITIPGTPTAGLMDVLVVAA